MRPGAQIDVAGTTVTVLSGFAWLLPDDTVVRCRRDIGGAPTWHIEEGAVPLIIANSLAEAITRHQQA